MCFTKILSFFGISKGQKDPETAANDTLSKGQKNTEYEVNKPEVSYIDVKSVKAVFDRLYLNMQDPDYPEDMKSEIIKTAIDKWDAWTVTVLLIVGVEDGVYLGRNEIAEIESYLMTKFNYAYEKYSKRREQMEKLKTRYNS